MRSRSKLGDGEESISADVRADDAVREQADGHGVLRRWFGARDRVTRGCADALPAVTMTGIGQGL